MDFLIGVILVVLAFSTVAGVLFFVMREQHDHEEHYIPGQHKPEEAQPIYTQGPDAGHVYQGETFTPRHGDESLLKPDVVTDTDDATTRDERSQPVVGEASAPLEPTVSQTADDVSARESLVTPDVPAGEPTTDDQRST